MKAFFFNQCVMGRLTSNVVLNLMSNGSYVHFLFFFIEFHLSSMWTKLIVFMNITVIAIQIIFYINILN